MEYAEIKENIETLRRTLLASQKRKLMCLSTTANRNNPPVCTSAVRETTETIAGSILFSQTTALEEIVTVFDGLVECFLVDTESKNELDHFPQAVSGLVKKSKVHFYKPNDLSVDALDEFIACLRNFLAGGRIVVAGPGNIGAKIGLRLSERGADVFLVGRDSARTEKIVAGLSLIKRGTGRLYASASLEESCRLADMLLGCTPGVAVINERTVSKLDPRAVIIDVGNGTLTKDGIDCARRRDLMVYCLSAIGGYKGFIANWLHSEKHLRTMGRRWLSPDVSIVTPGILGAYGEVLVEDLELKGRIIGVCDGKGDVLPQKEGRVFIDRLKAYDQRK